MAKFTYDDKTHSYYMDNIRVPGVTETIDPLSDIDKIPALILRPRAERGTDIHTMCQYDLQGRLDENPLSDEIKRILEQFNLFKHTEGRDFDLDSATLEYGMLHESLKYAGRPDIICDGHAVIDMKSSDFGKILTPLQLSGYENLWLKNGGLKANYEHWKLILDVDYYKFIPVNKTKKEKIQSWGRFRVCLDNYWQNKEFNRKLKIWKESR